jgi:glutamine---fructose-6-phosphate transaminase (isomerizing)
MKCVDRWPLKVINACRRYFRPAAIVHWIKQTACLRVYWGRCPGELCGPVFVLFPYSATTLACGLAGLITVRNRPKVQPADADWQTLESLARESMACPLEKSLNNDHALSSNYLGGAETLDRLHALACELKREDYFLALFNDLYRQAHFTELSRELTAFSQQEIGALQRRLGRLKAADADTADQRLEKLKDVAWCLRIELLENLRKVRELLDGSIQPAEDRRIVLLRNINAVLNSIDRQEVRGRDSAGISLLFILAPEIHEEFEASLNRLGLADEFKQRAEREVLSNASIGVHLNTQAGSIGVTFTYKVAAEIGCLGDNMRCLRREIAGDSILTAIAGLPHRYHTASAHTRWASVGAITIANCHPVDNATKGRPTAAKGIIHVCLNGDIDNYLSLKKRWAACGETIHEEITTDTKIIPLQIEHYLRQGCDVIEAFRMAVRDFEGSHAITMHTDLAPGKFFLAQKGSGQALFVGISKDHYMATSEVYGFVEETDRYIKLDGEKSVQGIDGPTQGQLFILDQEGIGGPAGIEAMYYDGTPIALTPAMIQRTQITSRDIDRQNFAHYFLKEISEAPLSMTRTLQNRWKISADDSERHVIRLDETSFPATIKQALSEDRIRRIYFIGQGTAGVAALVCADILNFYLNEPALKISAMKASELSGFQLGQSEANSMSDALVIAITQSGTTTDTNRAVAMARARGAHAMAIVNRRDSDITFKVQGVVYTSSGRDIEMSVASTKAFYSQIVAGALVNLRIAEIRRRRSAGFIDGEIKALLALPDQMRRVMTQGERIQASAQRLARSKIYWAAVGSGPNKAAADEIRIKLSELCYKTISSDYIEDKKHIDLSSEPLILICAAGANGSVIGDIIKDTAIFKAHKAAPVVIADEGETRFDPYAEDVIHVPAVQSHLAPILNTLAGHLWGYYAALAINDGSLFLHTFREEIRAIVEQSARDGLDVYELVLEKRFREEMAKFYSEFRQRQASGRLPSTISQAADLLLLLKYLAGRLPVSDFELDFGKKGTALNMLNRFFELLDQSINSMSRPVDAIKHQAKTVTVGTSRISEKIEGLLFETIEAHDIGIDQLTNLNILVLKNLQEIVARINGSILYHIDQLDVLGEPTEETTITILRKEGLLKGLPSRVEHDHRLQGTKRIIVRQGNVYIGKGRKDDRSILVIPAISTKPGASNRIEYLLLLNIEFVQHLSLEIKIKALGGKFEHIKNIVQENSLAWQDQYLEEIPIEELFGLSAEKIGERIVRVTRG